MEFRDLKTQYQRNRTAIDRAMSEVLTSGVFIGGNPVTELEGKLAEYVGVKHCITCANGTDALQLALMSWGIGERDAVFVPDFTFFATAEVVSAVNATPIFVDVEMDTFNMQPASLEKAIQTVLDEGKIIPKAVIAVDLFGQPADYPEIRKITEKYNLLLLEDGAQGFGGRIQEKKACSFGDISTTSFFPAKPLGCYGDGGAIFTNSDEWAELIKSYKVHGKGKDKYDNIRIGMNSRLDTLQAAILNVKFDIFVEQELEAVNRVAHTYERLLPNDFIKPTVREGYYSSWAQYTVLCKDSVERNRIMQWLKEEGIPSMIYYPKALHEQGAFERQRICSQGVLKNTQNICQRCLSLPIHPYLYEEDIKRVAQRICEYVQI